MAKYLKSRIEIGTVQYIVCRQDGIGADDFLITNFRSIAWVIHKRSQVGGNSIHTPSVSVVVEVDSGA